MIIQNPNLIKNVEKYISELTSQVEILSIINSRVTARVTEGT
jgi:hypothetical protein